MIRFASFLASLGSQVELASNQAPSLDGAWFEAKMEPASNLKTCRSTFLKLKYSRASEYVIICLYNNYYASVRMRKRGIR